MALVVQAAGEPPRPQARSLREAGPLLRGNQLAMCTLLDLGQRKLSADSPADPLRPPVAAFMLGVAKFAAACRWARWIESFARLNGACRTLMKV